MWPLSLSDNHDYQIELYPAIQNSQHRRKQYSRGKSIESVHRKWFDNSSVFNVSLVACCLSLILIWENERKSRMDQSRYGSIIKCCWPWPWNLPALDLVLATPPWLLTSSGDSALSLVWTLDYARDARHLPQCFLYLMVSGDDMHVLCYESNSGGNIRDGRLRSELFIFPIQLK